MEQRLKHDSLKNKSYCLKLWTELILEDKVLVIRKGVWNLNKNVSGIFIPNYVLEYVSMGYEDTSTEKSWQWKNKKNSRAVWYIHLKPVRG